MKTVSFNEIDIRPYGPGRPLTKDTIRARASVIHYMLARLKKQNMESFSARDIARKTRVDRDKVAIALRWLEDNYRAVVAVDTVHQNRRARPELQYKMDTKIAKKTLKDLAVHNGHPPQSKKVRQLKV